MSGLMTAEQEAAFRAERRQGVGGSDVAAILGLDPYRTAMDVWLEKVGRGEPEVNEAMRWGQILEPVIVDEVCIRRGYEPAGQMFKGSHPHHDWMRANIDSLIDPPPVDDHDPSLGILECKTTSTWQAAEWRDGQTPAPALVQWQWYAAVTGLRWGVIAGLVGGQRLEIVDVEPDAELIDMLIDRCGIFWHEHVVPRRPPPATGRDLAVLEAVYDVAGDARRSLEEFGPDDVREVYELVEHYRRLRRLAKTIGDRKDQTQAELAQWLGERGVEVLEFIPESAKRPRPVPLASWRHAARRPPHNCPNCDHPLIGGRRIYVTTRKEL